MNYPTKLSSKVKHYECLSLSMFFKDQQQGFWTNFDVLWNRVRTNNKEITGLAWYLITEISLTNIIFICEVDFGQSKMNRSPRKFGKLYDLTICFRDKFR